MTTQIDGYLLQRLGLYMPDALFHHGFIYNNVIFRGLRLDVN